MTARTILPEDDDGRDGMMGSGSCSLAAAGLWILSAQRRAQLWILTASGGWPLALAWTRPSNEDMPMMLEYLPNLSRYKN